MPGLCLTGIRVRSTAASCSKCDGAMVSLMNYRFWADQQAPVTEETATAAAETVETEDNARRNHALNVRG